MATLLLDFDSTLISKESLEEIMANLTEHIDEVKKITQNGMSGKVSFVSSLQKRLALVPISKRAVAAFCQIVHRYITPGMPELLDELRGHFVDIWIVSGAIRDVILPVAREVGIPPSHILGVELLWSNEGTCLGIDQTKANHTSKTAGVKLLAKHFTTPIIAVGDGMTDYELYEQKVATHFVAFTQHARYHEVVARSPFEARTVEELRACLFSRILKTK